jgi:2-methylcitrate dehydratase PrpD
MQAIQDFKAEQPFDPHRLTAVTVRGSGRMLEERHQVRDPRNVMGAQYSLPFATAIALTRDTADPLVFNDETVADPFVRQLAATVEIVPAEDGVEVVLETEHERIVLSARPFKGSPANPMDWDDVSAKFRRYSERSLSDQRVAAIIEAVRSLDEASDVAEMARLLSAD